MDWTQTLTIIGSVGAMWFGCFTVLRDDIKGIENRHKEDMKDMRAEHRESLAKMDEHWRDMFMYMNNKIDDSKKSS